MSDFTEKKNKYINILEEKDSKIKEILTYSLEKNNDLKDIVLDPKNMEELDIAFAYLSIINNKAYILNRMSSSNPITIDLENSAIVEYVCRIHDIQNNNENKSNDDFVKELYNDTELYAKFTYEMMVLKYDYFQLMDLIPIAIKRCDMNIYDDNDFSSFYMMTQILYAKEKELDSHYIKNDKIVKFGLCFNDICRKNNGNNKKYTKSNK